MKVSLFNFALLKTKKAHSIHTKQAFHRIFDRERDRSNRNGGMFSLVVLGLAPKSKKRASDLADMITAAQKRIRNIDDLGWFDDEHIGILLPETANSGAAKLANDIQTMLSPKIEIAFSVFTYPVAETSSARSSRQQQPDDPGQAPSSNSDYRFTNWIGKPMPPWKRAIDIVGAAMALIVLLPLFIAVAIFIKCVSPGPVFFRQERLGYRAKPFICWKFRTMKPDMDYNKHRVHVHDLIHNGKQLVKIDDEPDACIIPLGNMMRKLGIDELPQLFNVLRGDMSLIGPRPCMDYEAAEFRYWQNKRFDIHPGLTGLWQVSGKNRTTFDEMMRMDIRYGINRTLAGDLLIFLKTFPALVRQVTDKMTPNEADYETNY